MSASRRPDAARIGIEFGRLSGWSLETLAIHAMTFAAHATARRRRGVGLCTDVFDATDFGPRAASLELLTLPCAPYVMRDPDSPTLFFKRRERAPLRPEDAALVAEVHAALKGRSPGGFVAITHAHGGPWAHRYVPGLRIPIDDAALAAWPWG